MSVVERTDEELMVQLAEGDKGGLAELARRYQNDLFRFSLHYLRDAERAKEMAQETFIRVYTARERFDPKRKFKPWMLCIARNLCLNEIKRKKTVPMESLEEYASTARDESGEIFQSAWDSPDQAMMNEERMDLLREALASLDDEAREIVVMRFFKRMQARDIAEVVGSTEGAVRTRLHRILKSLRNTYEEAKVDL